MKANSTNVFLMMLTTFITLILGGVLIGHEIIFISLFGYFSFVIGITSFISCHTLIKDFINNK